MVQVSAGELGVGRGESSPLTQECSKAERSYTCSSLSYSRSFSHSSPQLARYCLDAGDAAVTKAADCLPM